MLKFGSFPNVRDEILGCGYQMTADGMSIIQGVVNRLHVIDSTHSGRKNLMIQTDAASNCGDEGGQSGFWYTSSLQISMRIIFDASIFL